MTPFLQTLVEVLFKEKMKRNWIIITVTSLALLAVAFLAINLYTLTKAKVVSEFEEHQLLHAENLASDIELFLETLERELRILSMTPFLPNPPSSQLKSHYAKAIFLNDDEIKKRVISSDASPTVPDHVSKRLLTWARKKENRGKIYMSGEIRPEEKSERSKSSNPSSGGPENVPADKFEILLATPVYQNVSFKEDRDPQAKFIGVLCFSVDLKEFLAKQSLLGDLEMSLHQVWIIDQDGTLLFQTEHPEMVLRTINQNDRTCNSCHGSFDYAEKILKWKRGIVDYHVENSKTKLAAFAPVDLGNLSWVVVVNSEYDKVTAFAKRSLLEHLVLLGLVASIFLIGTAFLIRNDRLKVRAEEESRHWQELLGERKRAEEILQQERNKLKGILDTMPDGVAIVNQQHVIEYINPYLRNEFGPIEGRKCYEYFNARTEVCPWCNNPEVFSGKSVRWEWTFSKAGKTYDLFDTPLLNGNGTTSKLELFHDITERKKAEKALRESEERFRMLVETMNEGLGVIDENGVWTYVNEGLCDMLGYFPGDLTGRRVAEFIDETNQDMLNEQIIKRRNGESNPYEITYRRADGTRRNALVSPKPIFGEGRQPNGSFAIITDITKLKRTEESLRKSESELRYLSSQLLVAQESERRRISRELHDELGQSLALLKLQLSLTKKKLPEVLQHQYEEQMHSIDHIIENVRRLSRDLRPAALDDLGFSAALQWLIRNFEKNFGVKITLDAPDIDPFLPHDAQIMIYRVFQEALTNVGKHAGAKNVSVSIEKQEDRVSFVVKDDGKGFDVKKALTHHALDRGLGLSTMEERIRMLKGSLTLWSQEGAGTRISFTIPISNGHPLDKKEISQ